MMNFIIKRFVHNSEDVNSPETRESYGRVAGIVGIVSNAILCVFKIATGLIFNSIAILADGVNNLADASSSVITLIGFKLANRKPDKEHPYGHGRTEYLTGLVISAMVLVIGALLLKSSIDKTIHPVALDYSILSIVVLVVAILIKLWQTRFNIVVGKRINSNALIATGTDSRNDVISTSAVLLSLLIGRFLNVNIDGPVGIIVSLFIIYSGIGLIKETVSPILGKSPDETTVKEIEKIVMKGKSVVGFHDLIVHDYGPGRVFASCHAEVDSDVDIFEIHDEIDNIEKEIEDDLGIMMSIHMDPVNPRDPEVIKVKEMIANEIKTIEGVSSFHDVRIVPGSTHTNIVFDVVVEYECKYSDIEVKNLISKRISQIDSKYICVIKIDRNYT